MSYNGSGLFTINTTGQPVVSGTTISSSVFNAFTTDIATGLSNAICKDGQTTPTANIPMGGFRITGLGLGTATTDAARVDNANSHVCEFRLTLTTGVPVTIDDLNSETLYFTPFRGNKIALYTGGNWVMRSSAEMSIDVPDVTGVHDVFCYDNSGVPTLEVLVWTDSTTRATDLTTQDGVLVKSGDATRRYVGTFYSTTAGNGQIDDAVNKRYLWNYYNRVRRQMAALDGTDSWTYTTATFRQANNNTDNQLNLVVGVREDMVSTHIQAFAKNTGANVDVIVAVGLDTTTEKTPAQVCYSGVTQVANQYIGVQASLSCYPGIGKHFFSWNELSVASGTTTWAGDAGAPSSSQSGIIGECWA